MTVNFYEWNDHIDRNDLGFDLKVRAGRTRLNNRLKKLLSKNPAPRVLPMPLNLISYVDLYAEQVAADPVADMRKIFLRLSARGMTIGGLPTGFPPLAVVASDLRPNNTAISTIGEGLVGWYLQQRGLVALARPIGDGPDFIFVRSSVTGIDTILVEVKSTQQSGVKSQMSDAAIPRLQYTLNCATGGSYFSCCVIGVIIRNTDDFDVLNLEIELA
ncbi:MAG: hypothetical protein BZY75_03275 [SAR202 cluster bacterium Io17-Chloro-G7]|nr:MAG: hypothetical protein BZY75_03275 [SAR202 cluster bacterium Io17-Chloro-G7]